TIAARHLLAGMLRELNDYEDSRWVCWISNSPVKPLLDAARKQSGEHILQVVSRHSDLCTLAQRALNSGKSHTVVLRVEGELTAGQRQALEYAAANGDADCLLVKFS
ncbi:MAG: hypothetical protein R3311_20870, partial [Oceanisphaera sp.]|nr:hypothetical protein [Oceanisphaera sp.]